MWFFHRKRAEFSPSLFDYVVMVSNDTEVNSGDHLPDKGTRLFLHNPIAPLHKADAWRSIAVVADGRPFAHDIRIDVSPHALAAGPADNGGGSRVH